MSDPAPYRRPYPNTQPDYLFPKYASTVKRAPGQPLIVLPHTLSELTAPVFGYGDIKDTDHDLTRQHKAEPLGERIVVSGRVLDENGKPLPGVLVEIWQANAAGRYNHRVDQHDAPLDPNFTGAGRLLTDAAGRYRFMTIRPGEYPWRNHYNAWRPAHIHFSLFGPAIVSRLVTQMYFPGDPLLEYDPMFMCVADEKARNRLISTLDWETTMPEYALGYRFDIVLRGRDATPVETRG
ncbi:MAG: protocatechuate 3,4-dioxygenase subunit beta [Burkholderiales bacterium]